MKRFMALVLAMLMLFTLVACSSNTNSGGNTGSENSSNNGSANSDAVNNGSVAAAKKESIVVVAGAEPDSFVTFNPDNVAQSDEFPVLHNIYETLFKRTADGVVEPLLAKSYEISEDGTEYTIHLRDDVCFSNGQKMTAADVAFSYNINGNFPSAAALWGNYDYTEAVDEYTVKVHLTAGYFPIVNTFCSRYGLIYSEAYYNEVGIQGYSDNPVGTGPYVMTERVSGDHIQLDYNEEYWGSEPTYKHITMRFMSDTNTQMMALESGEADVIINANLSQCLKLDENKYGYSITDGAVIQHLRLNCTKGLCKDINFRKALQYALDREQINLGVFEGMATIVNCYGNPSFTGYPDDGTYTPVPDRDLEKAKEYLAAANYNGEEFVILTPAGSKNETAAQIIQGQLIEAGINATVSALDSVTYGAATDYGTGDFNAVVRAGTVSTISMDGIYLYFNGDQMAKMSSNQYRWIEPDEQFTELTNTARATTDEAKLKGIYAKVSSIVNENVWTIPIYSEVCVAAFNKDVENVVPGALQGLYYFNDWR